MDTLVEFLATLVVAMAAAALSLFGVHIKTDHAPHAPPPVISRTADATGATPAAMRAQAQAARVDAADAQAQATQAEVQATQAEAQATQAQAAQPMVAECPLKKTRAQADEA